MIPYSLRTLRISDWLNIALILFGRHRPLILFHKPTDLCDCKCRFCDNWVRRKDTKRNPTAEDIRSVLKEARGAGFIAYSLWGGEPLLVDAVADYLKQASDLGMETTMCTSGLHLAERAKEIGPHLDKLLISVEAVGERHDHIRGVLGLFGRIVTGLETFRNHGRGNVVLWSNLSRENMDQVENIAAFSGEMGVSVEFFPASLYPAYNENIILGPTERAEVFHRLIALKRRGFPVGNSSRSLHLMASGHPFTCNIPRLSVQLLPDGSLYPCEPRVFEEIPPYGTMYDTPISQLARSKVFSKKTAELKMCNRCLVPCVAGLSGYLPQRALEKLFRSFL